MMKVRVKNMKRQSTDKIFWINFIKDISNDVHDITYKDFLKTAVASHCRAYARLTNRSQDNIPDAVDQFFNEVNK